MQAVNYTAAEAHDEKQYLQDEKRQLDFRLNRLLVFRLSERCSKLDSEQRELVNQQITVMALYSGVLERRILNRNGVKVVSLEKEIL